jgi:predicted RNase H-like nuclease
MGAEIARPKPPGIGVDGCRGGWVWVAAGRRPAAGFAAHLSEVVGRFRKARILVDMPIGLPSGTNPRRCESLARRLAGPRRASIFAPPARAALAVPDYASANVANRRETGKGLSRQAWNLVPKIRQVDDLLRQDRPLAARLMESHPEICFRMLAGKPLCHYKKTAEGRRERLSVLEAHGAGMLPALFKIDLAPGSGVAEDDLVDAAVLAVVAALPDRALGFLPPEPQWDAEGLPMQMVVPLPPAGGLPAEWGIRRLK